MTSKPAKKKAGPKTKVRADKPKRGRPTKMTPEVIEEILTRIEAGETLTEICRDSEHIPAIQNVMAHRRRNQEFYSDFARARENAADLGFDRILELSRAFTPANAHAIRGEIDALKWWIGKVKPRDYSDKIIHAGHDGGPLTLSWKATEEQDVIDITPAPAIPEN